MSIENFAELKRHVLDILSSKTKIEKTDKIPENESFYSYENGIKTWVASIFVDIVDSSTLFSLRDVSEDGLARMMRAFTEQIIRIMNDNKFVVDFGIRGDCVYGVFDGGYKNNLVEVFRTAYFINSFVAMFNKLLTQNSYPNIRVGIGLGCGEDLIIRAGEKKVTSDKIWIGRSLVDASNLSSIANRNGVASICMSDLFYSNIIELLEKENPKYRQWIEPCSTYEYNGRFYMCDIVNAAFDSWINDGMKCYAKKGNV